MALLEPARPGVCSSGFANLWGHVHLVPNLGEVTRDQDLQAIGLGDESTKLLLVGRHNLSLDRGGLAQRIPVLSCEGFLDAVEQFGDGLESDDLLPGLSRDVRPCLS